MLESTQKIWKKVKFVVYWILNQFHRYSIIFYNDKMFLAWLEFVFERKLIATSMKEFWRNPSKLQLKKKTYTSVFHLESKKTLTSSKKTITSFHFKNVFQCFAMCKTIYFFQNCSIVQNNYFYFFSFILFELKI